MREDVARAQARAERPIGPGFLWTYILVGFVGLFLAAYVFTVAPTEPEWIIPDSLSGALLRDMVTRWQPWVFGLVGAWIGYKIGRLPVRPDA